MGKREKTPAGYRIGAASKLTGISPDTLRVWERRYGAVTPRRSEGGGRLYSSADIERLRLMKLLADGGDSIGAVAALDKDALEARARETRPKPMPSAAPAQCRLVVVGETLALKLRAAGESLPGLVVTASFPTPQAFLAQAENLEADILLLEQPTLQAETAVRLADWRARVKAACAVVVYRFAARDALRHLSYPWFSSLRAPVDPGTLQTHCLSILGHGAPEPANPEQGLPAVEPAPPRRFDDETLARLAGLSPTIKCECPNHLAELIASLGAFEKYSIECESLSPEDAALHAFLNATAARARFLIETALERVIEAEKIEL